MSYEVRVGGVTIIAPDEDSALSLTRRLLAEGNQPAEVKAPSVKPPPLDQVVKELLQAVAEAGEDGIESSALSQKLGLNSGKALSPYLIRAKARIEAAAPGDKILWRHADGGKWFADPERLKALGLV